MSDKKEKTPEEKSAGYTQFMFEMATSGYLTLSQAVEQLRENAHARTVRDTLAKAAGIPADEKPALQAFLVDRLMETDPGAQRDSEARKVRGWLNGDMLTISKQSAIRLCFALKLSLQEANSLLARLCGEVFHWRDPGEIVFIYSLMHGLSYPQAAGLYHELLEQELPEERREKSPLLLTGTVKQQLRELGGDAELKEYLRTYRRELGTFHNTAYGLFRDFLSLLSLPNLDDQLPDVKVLPMREIMNTYFYQQFIPRVRKTAKADSESEKLVLSALQKGIRQNWPDETTLSKMVHRETDVTRKVLILLFLATDGGTSPYGDDLDAEQTPDEVFADMHERMNAMLADCGFAPLDSRVPFDWMILYCMCADESIFIDGRVQRFLSGLFPMTDSTPNLADHGPGPSRN